MIEARELTKYYTHVPAVDAVSFKIKPGEVVGYLGPNGSGKSTTVKMLTGLLRATRGRILFEGRNIAEQSMAYRKRMGYVPEDPNLYAYMSGREYLQLAGRLRSIPEDILNHKVDELLQLFSLRLHRYAPIASYSKGMKQKILISAALLHNPDVLIFDEPLSGLDVASVLIFRNLVQALAREGKMILYSSHVLEIVEKVCSRVVILYKGRVVANDDVKNLRELVALPSLEEIFRQLALQEDTDRIASDIVGPAASAGLDWVLRCDAAESRGHRSSVKR
jgi:ABC-2 type transport system ATP-binding protein